MFDWYIRRINRVRLSVRWAIVVACAVTILVGFGRPWISQTGVVEFWAGEVNGPENSQQMADWYTLSHVIHGFIFYGLTVLLMKRWPWQSRLIVAVLLEAGWEVLENSPTVINRYREGTAAAGYSGDSILNSVFDIVWMTCGFLLAKHLPARVILGLAVVFELAALVVIRDNLILNILMLLWPIDAVKQWQAGA